MPQERKKWIILFRQDGTSFPRRRTSARAPLSILHEHARAFATLRQYAAATHYQIVTDNGATTLTERLPCR